MIKLFKLAKEIISINLKHLSSFRLNLVVSIIDSIIWFTIIISFYNIVLNINGNIVGWRINDIYILVATSEIIKSVIFLLFIENLPSIPYIVNNGELDNYIIKPYNTRFLISFKKLDFGNAAPIIPSIAIIVYSIIVCGYHITPIHILLYCIMLFLSIVLLYSIWIILTSTTFWISMSTSIHEFFLEMLAINKYPINIFKGGSRIVFGIVLPFIITTNVPISIFIKSFNLKVLLIYVIVTTFIYFIGKFIWNKGVLMYNGASK